MLGQLIVSGIAIGCCYAMIALAMVIIFKIATLYSPLKIFLPISATFFATGIGYYAYTYVTTERFTNMSMLLFSAAVIVFLIGLISEQITALTYSNS